MLYRMPQPAPTKNLVGRLLAALLQGRRRRRQRLDLLTLSVHFRRDLGLLDHFPPDRHS